MTSIRCAHNLLVATLLLLPAAFAQTGTTLDRGFDSPQTLPTLGGQLSGGRDLSFANPLDKYPRSVSTGAVTGGFTVATALSVGGSVTFYFPKRYFIAIDTTKSNTFSGASTTFTCGALVKGTASDAWDRFSCTIAGAPLAVGAQAFNFAAGFVITGAPTAAGTYKVETTVDSSMVVLPATAAIGGVITVGTMAGTLSPQTISSGSVTFGFTAATPLPVGSTVTLSLPPNYFSAVSSSAINTFDSTKATATCALTKATVSAATDSVVCTTAGHVLSAAAQTLIFIAGAVTAGVPTANTEKFTISTSTDRVSSQAAVVVLGGAVTVTSDFAFAADADKIPGSVNTNKITFKFTPTTSIPVGGKITIALPPKYFRAVDSSKVNTFGDTTATCTLMNGVFGTKVLGIDGADSVLCTTGTQASGTAETTFTFIAGAVKTGSPQAAAKFAVATSVDLKNDAKNAAALGGQITSTSAFAFATTDAVPYVTNAAAATTGMKFTIETALVVGGKFTISLPKGYFSAVDSTKSATVAGTTTATCLLAPGTYTNPADSTDVLIGGDQVICTTAVADIASSTAIEFKFAVGQVTMGAARTALTKGVQIETSADRKGTAADAPKVGDRLTTAAGVTSWDAADLVPYQLNTKAITFAFTPVTPLLVGGKFTLIAPKAFFSKIEETKVSTITNSVKAATCTCVFLASTGIIDTDMIICTTAVATLSAVQQTVTFAAGTATTAVAIAKDAPYNFETTNDIKLATALKAAALGSTISAATAIAFTNLDDKIPGKFPYCNNTITFAFTPATSIPIGGKITLSLPSNYFSKVDSTQAVAVGTAATAKCSLTSNAVPVVSASITLSDNTAAKTGVTITISIVPSVASGVSSIAVPLAGFSLDTISAATCTANCASSGKVTASLTNGVLTITLESDNSISKRNVLTTFTVTVVTNPSDAGWATSGISAGLINNFPTQVVCTTAGAIVVKDVSHTVTFPAGSVAVGTGQKASTFTIETSADLPLAGTATVALGGGMMGYKPLAFSNAQDQIPGRRNSGSVIFGISLSNSVPIGGQVILTLPSNYFMEVDSKAAVTMTQATARRTLLQVVTLSCVRTAGTPIDTITCTTRGAASGTGAQMFTFPAGSLVTGLPTGAGGLNIATANPPSVVTRIPYFPKASSSIHAVAWLLTALSALLACI
jgi:hypothetical protein